jgi:hypothetical protein
MGLFHAARKWPISAGERCGMDFEAIKPSRRYYVLAGLLIVVGVALFVVTLWRGISSIPSKVQQLVAPGKAELTLAKAGDYTIFYESQSVFGGRVYSTGRDVPGLECEVVAKSTGAPVALKRSNVNTTYELGGRSGRSVFDFHIDRPGVYQITSAYPEGQEGEKVVLAVGQGVAMRIVILVFECIGILFGSIALSVAIIVVTAIKRHNAAKRLSTAGGPPPPIE